MSGNIILVLEDDQRRTTWLRKVLVEAAAKGEFELVHSDTVRGFSALLDQHRRRLAMVILDCDLGLGSSNWPLDANGENGITMATSFPRGLSGVPVLIWSQNVSLSKQMRAALQARGYDAKREHFTDAPAYAKMVLALARGYGR